VADFIAVVDASPTAFDNAARNVAGELAGRALSASYMLDKVAPRLTEFILPLATSGPWGIAAGPDGNLWFTMQSANQIGRITPSGVITSFSIPTPGSQPYGIAAGPDGNLWFTAYGANEIGRITTSGVITEFALSTLSEPWEITLGQLLYLWEIAVSVVARLSDLNAFDQPGVEEGKHLTYGLAGRPGFEEKQKEAEAWMARRRPEYVL